MDSPWELLRDGGDAERKELPASMCFCVFVCLFFLLPLFCLLSFLLFLLSVPKG